MKQEDKEILLKDLCARLPYRVMVTHKLNINVCGLVSDIDRFGNSYVQHHGILKIDEIKPYLRPMSSMNEEEKEEFENLLEGIVDGIERWDKPDLCEEYDWLNSHHFDYRGLIEKGLALEAPEDMY